MGKSDNGAKVSREQLTRTFIHLVDGRVLKVKGNVINEFPCMSGGVGFLQLNNRRVAVNLDNVTYMEVI